MLATVLALSGCGLAEKAGESPVLQAAGIVPDQPCTITPIESRRLAGLYLRKVNAAEGFDLIYLTGALRKTGLPRTIRIDDRRVRSVKPAGKGGLSGTRQARAEPIALFAADGLPAAYRLSYSAKDVAYGGPMVIGRSPAAEDVPSAGDSRYAGPIELEFARPGTDAAPATTRAIGRFSLNVGHGSGTADLRVSELVTLSGPPLGFSGLAWSRLGLCGARVASTGRGAVRLIGPDGAGSIPFQQGRGAAPFRAELDSVQFGAAERPGPPEKLGGVLLLAGDGGTITASFLSR